MGVRLVMAVVAVLALRSEAGAADTAAAREAKASYDKGVAAYGLGRFDEAISAFARANALDPAPNLLYNLAQAHWKKGDLAAALGFYRRYLEADPRAENRPQVEERIRELEKSLAAENPPQGGSAKPASAPGAVARQPSPPVPAASPPTAAVVGERPPPPPASPPLHRRGWFWGAAAAVVLGATGAVLLAAEPWRRDQAWVCPDCNLPTYRVPPR